MPQLKKAELIEGIVYMASPVGAGVREYLVWIADESRLVWWRLADDEFVEIPADADGLMASVEFPGLVIDAAALTSGDLAAALAPLG